MGSMAKVGLALAAIAVAGVVVLGAVVIAGRDGGSSGSDSSRGQDSAPMSTTAGGENPANPVLGSWSAPCDRIMTALQQGETFEELTCTGNYRIQFAPDGSFIQSAGGTQTVTSPDGDFSQTLPWSANYSTTWATDGDKMRLGGSSSSPVSITPDEQDDSGLPIASLTNTGMFDFELSGNTLTLHPTFPAIGRVTLIYDRV